MNQILQLKGRFEQRPNLSKPNLPKLPKGKWVTSAHLSDLSMQLERILAFWKNNPNISGALVSVHYWHIVAKSNRLKILLSERGKSPVFRHFGNGNVLIVQKTFDDYVHGLF